MPGVGPSYQVSTSMLLGVAILTITNSTTSSSTSTIQQEQQVNDPNQDEKNDNNSPNTTIAQKVWKYFPKESIVPIHCNNDNNKLMLSIDEQLRTCMDILFTAKESWLLEELYPYLERIIDVTTSTGSDKDTNAIIDSSSILSNTLVRYTKVVLMKQQTIDGGFINDDGKSTAIDDLVKYYQRKQ
jgi:hypothetical protein